MKLTLDLMFLDFGVLKPNSLIISSSSVLGKVPLKILSIWGSALSLSKAIFESKHFSMTLEENFSWESLIKSLAICLNIYSFLSLSSSLSTFWTK